MQTQYTETMIKVNTYHLDQNVRGFLSKGKIGEELLDKYYPEKHEAILPFALLEYAGIDITPIFEDIDISKEILAHKPNDYKEIKNYLENKLKEKLPQKIIEKYLNNQLNFDNDYAHPYIIESIKILPRIYDIIIAQLSWDRFSQIKWNNENIINKKLLPEIQNDLHNWIINVIVKENHLYALRYCNSLHFSKEDEKKENIAYFIDIINKSKIKSLKDIGDCELIHVAINGQQSPSFQNTRIVDCYTMDPAKDIKRRLISLLFLYNLLEIKFNHKFDSQYCNKIYIVNEEGKKIDTINVKDYLPYRVMEKIENQDLEILFLLN